MKCYLKTERLLLRGWKQEDRPEFVRMNRDLRVMEYFLKPLTVSESDDLFRRIQEEFVVYGFGLFAVEKADTHKFIGWVGLHHFDFDVDFAPGIEIGWRLLPEAWGKGYAPEAAAACMEFAFQRLHLEEVYSFTALSNERSQRVMQKIGMERLKEFGHPCVDSDHPLYRHVVYVMRSGEKQCW